MEHLEQILQSHYDNLENKSVFLPLIIANAIICYKLSHDDEVYWMNFSKKSCEYKIENMNDIYLFFIDFLPQTSQFKKSYQRKIDHLKEFHIFLEDFFYKQKFYYKNPDDFEKHLARCITGIPNPKVGEFCSEIFLDAAKIRFQQQL